MTRPPLPRAVAIGRREVCRMCPTPCDAYAAGRIAHGHPNAACPLPEPRWRTWADVLQGGQAARLGLGDAVAVVAKPIARGIDAATRRTRFATDLEHCGGCGQRKATLNEVVPDVLHPFRQ